MNAIMKKLVLGIALSILGISLSWAQGGTEPKPKNTVAAQETILVVCTKSPYPGGMSCSAPTGLGVYYTSTSLDDYLTYDLGCSATSSSVYSCKVNGLNGMVMFWMFSSSYNVSAVLYVPWDIYY